MQRSKPKRPPRPQIEERAATRRDAESEAKSAEGGGRAMRETIESIVIAFILAFLFRAFEAEAFVIPTGSMAPTLMGAHKDLECDQCGKWYQAGASVENDEPGDPKRGDVLATTCPMCGYTQPVRAHEKWSHATFTGDRILVSKFAYELGEPRRWDVIVFKYPQNAKQNYIKRLVGLPGEEVWIYHGDIYTRAPGAEEFEIARKPPRKIRAMLQDVHDTRYIPQSLIDAGWPSRWDAWPTGDNGAGWQVLDGGRQFSIAADASAGERVRWLRYRHLLPPVGWQPESPALPAAVAAAQSPTAGQLITDFYGYNTYLTHPVTSPDAIPEQRVNGYHWVGDLAVECDVAIESRTGAVVLNLVKGGRHHQCRIDIATGAAQLTIDGGAVPFLDDAGRPGPTQLTAATRVRGGGRHRLLFANVDSQLTLWVNGWVVSWSDPATGRSSEATFAPRLDERPVWSPEEPGDLAPAGVGSAGAALRISRLRLLRDIYYIAVSSQESYGYGPSPLTDYDFNRRSERGHTFDRPRSLSEVLRVLQQPEEWATTPVFDLRRDNVRFQLKEDQFFPLGDNSPESRDGRLWDGHHFVQRRYLTGKALLIYWPHALREPVPFVPNFQRMTLIR